MSRIITHDIFIKEMNDLVGDEYSFLTEYKGTNKKIKIRHNCEKCNYYEYEATPNNFKRGKRCPKCANNIKRTNESFLKEVYNLVGDEYSFLENYINTDTPILVTHNVCNYKYKVAPKEFICRNSRCPKCNHLSKESYFSKIIKNFLYENNILYFSEVSIKELSKGKKFDFFLPEYNLFIEYDGMQHFYPKFNTEESLLKQIKSDNIKNNFMKNAEIKFKELELYEYYSKTNFKINTNQISLLRISYKQNKKIYDILKQILLEENSTTIEKQLLLYIEKDNIINDINYYTNCNKDYFELLSRVEPSGTYKV